MDDEIIYSWCFHDVECFDSTPSAAIIILDKDLESFSSLRSQHKGYQSVFYPRLVRMSKRGRTSTMSDDVHASTPTLHPPRSETGMSTSILMLTSTNYRLWAMRMKYSSEVHGLWGVIDGSEVNQKKDRFALSMILNSISESQSNQIDIKKSGKEN